MGNLLDRIFSSIIGKKEMKILVLGLAGAGKTTFIYKLKIGEIIPTVPTIGFNVESIEYKKLRFTMWDIGGQDAIRKLWKYYFERTNGIIFIVDSSDTANIELAKKELHQLLEEEELEKASLLVLANKMDLGMMTVSKIAEELGLLTLKNREWFIQGSCLLTGDGIKEGLDWLAKSLTRKVK